MDGEIDTLLYILCILLYIDRCISCIYTYTFMYHVYKDTYTSRIYREMHIMHCIHRYIHHNYMNRFTPCIHRYILYIDTIHRWKDRYIHTAHWY